MSDYDKIASSMSDAARFLKGWATRTAAKVDPDSVRELDNIGDYDKEKVKHIADLLYNVSSALGYIHVATQELNSLRGHEISPDGKLGGKGYVITLKKFKDSLSSVGNTLSDLDDSLSDELNNPRWGLTPDEKSDILRKRDDLKDNTTVQAQDDTEGELSDDQTATSEEDGELPYEVATGAKTNNGDIPYSPADDVTDEELDSLRKKYASSFGSEPDPLRRPIILNMIAKGNF